jgi:hypothetical protein
MVRFEVCVKDRAKNNGEVVVTGECGKCVVTVVFRNASVGVVEVE